MTGHTDHEIKALVRSLCSTSRSSGSPQAKFEHRKKIETQDVRHASKYRKFTNKLPFRLKETSSPSLSAKMCKLVFGIL